MIGKSEILLGLGSNLGAAIAQLGKAAQELGGSVEDVLSSSVHRSAPVGYISQPDFLNLVCRARTDLPPLALLHELQRIEHAFGRTRPFPNAPRTIDIDILAYGDLILDTPELTLPHPRMHQRAFVLVPLAEIAPEWRHPVFGKTAAELLASGGPFERIERWGELPLGS